MMPVALVTAPKQVVPLLRERLLVALPTPPDAQKLARLIAELNSDQFTVRTKAKTELGKMGVAAVSFVVPAAIGPKTFWPVPVHTQAGKLPYAA